MIYNISFIEDGIIKMIENINNTDVNSEPYQFFTLENIFPFEFYRYIISSLPEFDKWRWSDEKNMSEKKRLYFDFSRKELNSLSVEKKKLWSYFKSKLLTKHFFYVIAKKFGKEINDRLLAARDTSRLTMELMIRRDYTGYSLLPHTDHPDRVFTLMFYIPKDESLSEYGTVVYKPLNKDFVCDGLARHSTLIFEVAAKTKFLQNTGMCFLKSNKSFHGVDKILEDGIERDIIAITARLIDNNESLRSKVGRVLRLLKGNENKVTIKY